MLKCLIVIFFLFVNPILVLAQTWNAIEKIVASDREPSSDFGFSIDVSGDYMVVGSPLKSLSVVPPYINNSGAVYIYKKNVNNRWVFEQKLINSDNNTNDHFGRSVSISGDFIVVGAPEEDDDLSGNDSLNRAGSIYIFKKNNSGYWMQTQKIIASDREAFDEFGYSVSMLNNYLVVGSYYEDEDELGGNSISNSGSAYVFKKDTNDLWYEIQKIVAFDRAADDNFGWSVKIDDDFIAIGAYNEDEDSSGLNTLSNAGSVYIFKNDGIGNWNFQDKVVSSDRNAGDFFGFSVSIYNSKLIVGAYGEDDDEFGNNPISNAGAAYIFEYDSLLTNWVQVKKMVAPSRAIDDYFGYSVDINNYFAVAGAHQEDHDENELNVMNKSGSIYMFGRNTLNNWEYDQKVISPERASVDLFGLSVVLNQSNVYVGVSGEDQDPIGNTIANAGAVYIFSTGGVFGSLFKDFNFNCTKESNEAGVNGWYVSINPGSYIVETNPTGRWYIDSLPIGTYTVSADTSGYWFPTCSSTQIFNVIHHDSTVITNPVGMLSTQLCTKPNISIMASSLRRCFSNQNIFVNVSNGYDATDIMLNYYTVVELDSFLTVTGASIPYTSIGNNKFQFYLDTLYPGENQNFKIITSVSCDALLGQTLCNSATIFPIDSCVLDSIITPGGGGVLPCGLPWDKSSISVDGWCQNDSIFFVITNTGQFGGGDMECYSALRLYIDGQLILFDSILLLGQDSDTLVFSGDGRTWRLEVDQHPLHPGNSHPNATVELCGNDLNWTSDLVNILPQDDADPIIDIFCGVVSGSFDPNDKTGYPLGLTDTHFISPNQKLEYLIRFQNTGTDTAFTVVIRDTLEMDFNIFSVQSGASSHNYSFTMHGPRVLEWTFPYIMLPDRTTDEEGSHGFVTFSVDQIANLAQGTELNNEVGIYFDFNAPVITNTTSHIIKNPESIPDFTGIGNYADTGCDEILYNGIIYDLSGTYYQIQNDSLFSLSLTVNHSTDSLISIAECNEYVLNSQTYTSSGYYTQILSSGVGCDSILTLNLTINNVDSSVTQNNLTLTANTNGATYQWLDCNNGYSIITNEMNQSFTPTVNGSYAVSVTENGCTDTSACFTINTIGVSENSFGANIRIYPNPSNGKLFIDLGKITQPINVSIKNAIGQTVFENQISKGGIVELNLNVERGIYFVELVSQEGSKVVYKLVID